jgi:glucose-1-phosphate thymidylyltransferase
VKAVVLARGKGTRMRRSDGAAEALTDAQRRAADAGMKAMMPIGMRPFLDYALSALADAGCTDVCLVVAPDADAIRAYYGRERPPERLRIAFAVQHEPRGTADALLSARGFAGGDPFLVVNSDNYYPVDVLERLAALDRPGLPAFSSRALVELGNIAAERVRHYAILRIAADGTLEDIIEKPGDAAIAQLGDSFVSMNCWRFDARIFEACAAIEPSPRAELELPNAVRFAARQLGQRFMTFPVQAGVLDLSQRADVATVAARLAGVEARP